MRPIPVAVLVLAALGCASPDEYIAYCEPTPSAPAAAADCLAQPEVNDLVLALRPIVEPAAGPLKIRIAYTETEGIDSVCAIRADVSDAWPARMHMAEILPEIHAIGPTPACLAGTHLELNRGGAKLAEIEQELQSCAREAQPGADDSVPTEIAVESRARRLRACIESAQIRRGEIWLLEIPLVFVRREGGAERREAIRACTRDESPIGRSIYDAQITRVRFDRAALSGCLEERGWESAL